MNEVVYQNWLSPIYLGSGLPGCLSLCCHGPLKVFRQSSIFAARWMSVTNTVIIAIKSFTLYKGKRVNLTFLLFPLLFPSLQWPRPASSVKNHLFWLMNINCCVGDTCMAPAMLSLSLRISWRFFVPRMFLSDVCASSLENGHLMKNSEIFPEKPTLCCDECPSRLSRSRWRWTRGNRPRRPLTQSRCPWSEAAM